MDVHQILPVMLPNAPVSYTHLDVYKRQVLYIAQPTKMLFGFVEPGVFSERITKVNEHGIPTKAIVFQATLISVLLIGVSLSLIHI